MSDVSSQGVWIGPILRERRETLGLSLDDAESSIHIRTKYLIALEADAWQNLPGEIVGRGFLQNYAEFLQLDAQELKQRRQQAVDAELGASWTGTSAGTPMPAPRSLDYRPLSVRMSGEAFDTGLDRRTRRGWLLAAWVLLAGLLVGLFLQVVGVGPDLSAFGNRNLLASVTDPTRNVLAAWTETINRTYQTALDAVTSPGPGTVSPAPDTAAEPTPTPVLAVEVPQVQATATPVAVILPTPTSTSVPAPTPVPTSTVVQAQPDDTLAATTCPNEWARIVSPLAGQVIGGEVQIVGTAFHAEPDIWYYKLERAEANGVFLYFAGQQSAVENGVLGTLDTRFMANGAHTLRLSVIDLSGVSPLICDIGVVVQN